MTEQNFTLTSYDRQRKPHLPPKQPPFFQLINPCQLRADFQCPVCLELLRDTMITRQCLHRFCCNCISTALRNGRRECPTCRHKLVSRRSLRKDAKFDKLIEVLFPDREALERHENEVLDRFINRNLPPPLLQLPSNAGSDSLLSSSMATASSTTSTATTTTTTTTNSNSGSSASMRSLRKASVVATCAVASLSGAVTTSAASSRPPAKRKRATPGKVKVLEQALILRPEVETERDICRFVKVPEIATIAHIAKYLAIRHRLESASSAHEDPDESQDLPNHLEPEFEISARFVNGGVSKATAESTSPAAAAECLAEEEKQYELRLITIDTSIRELRKQLDKEKIEQPTVGVEGQDEEMTHTNIEAENGVLELFYRRLEK